MCIGTEEIEVCNSRQRSTQPTVVDRSTIIYAGPRTPPWTQRDCMRTAQALQRYAHPYYLLPEATLMMMYHVARLCHRARGPWAANPGVPSSVRCVTRQVIWTLVKARRLVPASRRHTVELESPAYLVVPLMSLAGQPCPLLLRKRRHTSNERWTYRLQLCLGQDSRM